jgi:hypothetical protein
VLLDNISTSVTTVALANNTTQAYGTNGSNDSCGQMVEARNYTKWSFQLLPLSETLPTGFQVALLGTISPWAYLTWEMMLAGQGPAAVLAQRSQPPPQYPATPAGRTIPLPTAYPGFSNAAGFFPGIQPWEWFLLPGPSEQSGAGGAANPLTTNAPFFTYTLGPIIAVRAIVVAQGTAGAVRVVASAVP